MASAATEVGAPSWRGGRGASATTATSSSSATGVVTTAVAATTAMTTKDVSDLVHGIVTRVAQQQDSPSKSISNEDSMMMMMGSTTATAASFDPSQKPSPRATSSPSSAATGGPLTMEEIKALLLMSAGDGEDEILNSGDGAASSHSSSGGIGAVEREELVSLVEGLQAHVNWARKKGMVVDQAVAVWRHHSQGGSPTQASLALGQWLKDRAKRHLHVLGAGLDAACVILRIAVAARKKRAVHEDAIGAAVALARAHLTKNLIPSLQQSSHWNLGGEAAAGGGSGPTPSSPSPSRRRSSQSGPDSPPSGRGNGDGGTPAEKGLAAAAARELKKVYRIVLAGTCDAYLKLIEQTDRVLRSCALEDQQVLMLTSGVMRALELDAVAAAAVGASSSFTTAYDLQVSALTILTSVFRHFPHHRATLVEDLFVLLPRIPSTKKALRSAVISYDSVEHSNGFAAWNASLSHTTPIPRTIQMFTALLLSLLLSVVERPKYAEEGKESGGNAAEDPQRAEANRDDDNEADDTDNEDEDEDDEQGSSNNKAAREEQNGVMAPSSSAVRFRSGLENVHLWAESMSLQLLKRVRTSKSDRDYRPLLSNLVEDLLVVWTIPEYGVAEVLLLALVRRLTMDILQKSPQCLKALNSPKELAESIETPYLNAAFDQLGRIAAAEARLLRESREAPLSPTESLQAGAGDTRQSFKCYCGEPRSPKFIVDCDGCGAQYHVPCVGLGRDAVPEDWYCDACRLARVLDRSGGVHRAVDANASSLLLDATYALQHCYVSHLSHREGLPVVRAATRYHLARWAEQLSNAEPSGSSIAPDRLLAFEKAKQALVLRVLAHWDGPGGPAAETLTETGTIRMVVATMAHVSPFLTQFKSQVGNLLTFLGDDIHSLRKLSLKAIEKMMEGDPQLMVERSISRAVSRRLSDEQTSVREAALSLVGFYVTKSPAIAASFEPALLACLEDVGVSVRKRSVKIFQDLLSVAPLYEGRSKVFASLLERVVDPREEDSLRDTIHQFFFTLWLEKDDIAARSHSSGADDDIVAVARAKVQSRAAVVAEQMVDVVEFSGDAGNLETLLRGLLRGAAINDNKSRKQAEKNRRAELARTHCDLLVSSLFEQLLKTEEHPESDKQRPAKAIAATLQTIGIFAALAPQFVLRRVDVVFPYLKADNGVAPQDELVIVTATCEIVHRLASVCGNDIAAKAGEDVPGDLRLVAYKFGSTAREAAIRTLAVLSNYKGVSGRGDFGESLLELCHRFYTFLYKKLSDGSNTNVKVLGNIHRALSALGYFCEYGCGRAGHVDWNQEISKEESDFIPHNDLAWDNVLVACYRVFRHYLDANDTPTKCAALRAIAGLFASQPQLMHRLEQEQLLDRILTNEHLVQLRLTALQCLRRILLGEQKRVDGRAEEETESDKNVSSAKKISGDQDSDASLFGGILASHADQILKMTQCTDLNVRFAAVELIAVLLQQGQVNPNDAVPYLFALQGDHVSTAVRERALQLLMAEGEKSPDMLRQRFCAGVKKAYDFQRSLHHDGDVTALTRVRVGDVVSTECVFGNVFKECLVRNRMERQGFYRNLLAFFVEEDSADPVGGMMESPQRPNKRRKSDVSASRVPRCIDLGLLCFASQILAHLPYEASGDPLFIIREIMETCWLHEGPIIEGLATLLVGAGVALSDAMDVSASEEDALERSARSKFPSKTKEAKALVQSDFDVSSFAALCCRGAALTLLLRLKQFLRQLYNLSDIRIAEYDPSGKETAADKGISRSSSRAASARFESAVLCGPGRGRPSASDQLDLDQLIRLYAEFRRTMRAESMDADASFLEDDENGNDDDGNDDDAKGVEPEGGLTQSAGAAVEPSPPPPSKETGSRKGRASRGTSR